MRLGFIAATLAASLMASPAAASPAAGQSAARKSQRGKVSALVTDVNGARIAGARVVFEWEGFRRVGAQNDELIYEAELPPGVYSVTASASGFCPAGAPNVHLKSGDDLRVEVMLNVAAIANVMLIKDGEIVGERDELQDPSTHKPCGLEAAPRAAPTPQVLLASAQVRKGVKPPAKTQPKASAKTQAKSPAKTAAKPAARAAKTNASTTQAGASRASTPGVVNLSTQPGAVVWVDEVFDAS